MESPKPSTADPSLRCGRCPFEFSNVAELNLHEKDHVALKPYRCMVCSENTPTSCFSDLGACSDHLKQHGEGIAKLFGCGLCLNSSKTYIDEQTLLRHLNGHHTLGGNVFACHFCSDSFADLKVFLKHVEKSHRVQEQDIVYKCGTCTAKFNNVVAFTNHQLTRHGKFNGQEPFKCRWCEKAFWDTYSRNRHEYKHSKETPYVCQLCDRRFNEESGLRMHLKPDSGKCCKMLNASTAAPVVTTSTITTVSTQKLPTVSTESSASKSLDLKLAAENGAMTKFAISGPSIPHKLVEGQNDKIMCDLCGYVDHKEAFQSHSHIIQLPVTADKSLNIVLTSNELKKIMDPPFGSKAVVSSSNLASPLNQLADIALTSSKPNLQPVSTTSTSRSKSLPHLIAKTKPDPASVGQTSLTALLSTPSLNQSSPLPRSDAPPSLKPIAPLIPNVGPPLFPTTAMPYSIVTSVAVTSALPKSVGLPLLAAPLPKMYGVSTKKQSNGIDNVGDSLQPPWTLMGILDVYPVSNCSSHVKTKLVMTLSKHWVTKILKMIRVCCKCSKVLDDEKSWREHEKTHSHAKSEAHIPHGNYSNGIFRTEDDNTSQICGMICLHCLKPFENFTAFFEHCKTVSVIMSFGCLHGIQTYQEESEMSMVPISPSTRAFAAPSFIPTMQQNVVLSQTSVGVDANQPPRPTPMETEPSPSHTDERSSPAQVPGKGVLKQNVQRIQQHLNKLRAAATDQAAGRTMASKHTLMDMSSETPESVSSLSNSSSPTVQDIQRPLSVQSSENSTVSYTDETENDDLPELVFSDANQNPNAGKTSTSHKLPADVCDVQVQVIDTAKTCQSSAVSSEQSPEEQLPSTVSGSSSSRKTVEVGRKATGTELNCADKVSSGPTNADEESAGQKSADKDSPPTDGSRSRRIRKRPRRYVEEDEKEALACKKPALKKGGEGQIDDTVGTVRVKIEDENIVTEIETENEEIMSGVVMGESNSQTRSPSPESLNAGASHSDTAPKIPIVKLVKLKESSGSTVGANMENRSCDTSGDCIYRSDGHDLVITGSVENLEDSPETETLASDPICEISVSKKGENIISNEHGEGGTMSKESFLKSNLNLVSKRGGLEPKSALTSTETTNEGKEHAVSESETVAGEKSSFYKKRRDEMLEENKKLKRQLRRLQGEHKNLAMSHEEMIGGFSRKCKDLEEGKLQCQTQLETLRKQVGVQKEVDQLHSVNAKQIQLEMGELLERHGTLQKKYRDLEEKFTNCVAQASMLRQEKQEFRERALGLETSLSVEKRERICEAEEKNRVRDGNRVLTEKIGRLRQDVLQLIQMLDADLAMSLGNNLEDVDSKLQVVISHLQE